MVKLKEIDEKRNKAKKILLKALDENKLPVEEIKVLSDCLENLRELTDMMDYLGNESIKFAEKRKDRN